MEKQQGLVIVEGLRAAQAGGAAVVELQGDAARDFNWVTVEDRKELLGSFGVEVGKRFFVLVASTPRSTEDFQFMVYEKFKGSPVLTTKTANAEGIVWTYSPTKQDAHNELRKAAFLKAANARTLTFPLPHRDLEGFCAAVNRAIELRRLADAAGGASDGGDDDYDDPDNEYDGAGLIAHLYKNEAERHLAATLVASTVRTAHSVNPKSWCLSNPGGSEKLRVNVGAVRVLDLRPGMFRLAVDGTKLSAEVRASLGSALDLSDNQRLAAFGDNGIVDIASAAFDTLPDEVRVAHEALVKRAAETNSPFARHHRAELVEALESLLGEQLPEFAVPQTRFWKISPGENGEQWDECRNGGFIAIGWNKLGDLTNVDHDEFKRRASELDASSQVWKFRNIEVGDRIVANAGTKRILGIGTVAGPYYYTEGAKHAHRLPVQWDDTTQRSVEMKGWVKTLIRLKQDVFNELQAAPPVGWDPGNAGKPKDGPRDGGADFEDILDQLRDESLSFSAELVASYLLALQAKRFVLLTGISGTGKTRLAQEVAKAFEDAGTQGLPAGGDQITLQAKPFNRKYSRFIVPSELAQEFDALTDPDTKRIDLKLPGLPRASMSIGKRANTSLLEVLLSGSAREWFMSNVQLGDHFMLSRQTDGDDEWLELRLPEPGKQQSRPGGTRCELVAVRPDWTDKSAILGFYNPLTREYVSTPILRLLLRARDEVAASTEATPPRPYFLIFDEMNLARVEHYFSDFLSAMESGDAIHLHDDAQVEDASGIPRRLTLPKNLFVVGTVNIDETTYMFSPKVLDRAFVLEFNEVNLDGIGRAIDAEESTSTPLALARFERLEMRGKATDAEWQSFEQVLAGEPLNLLRKIHDALSVEHRHFGYRVAREVARFVDLAATQSDGKSAAARTAFDVAVLAKILPKLHGSQVDVEEILKQLLSIAIGGRSEDEVIAKDGSLLVERGEIPLPQSARKLWRMLRRVRSRGFVSFIE